MALSSRKKKRSICVGCVSVNWRAKGDLLFYRGHPWQPLYLSHARLRSGYAERPKSHWTVSRKSVPHTRGSGAWRRVFPVGIAHEDLQGDKKRQTTHRSTTLRTAKEAPLSLKFCRSHRCRILNPRHPPKFGSGPMTLRRPLAGRAPKGYSLQSATRLGDEAAT
jgi:hypothetical protein